MAIQKFVNNFESSLVVAVAIGDTVIQLPSAATFQLPTLTGGDWYILTLFHREATVESQIEIVKVTNVDPNGGGNLLLTVVRAQEGTTAQAHAASDLVSMRVTKGGLENMAQTASVIAKQDASAKDASGGFPGLTGYSLNLKNAAGTVTSFLLNTTTASRNWTLPDKSGTVAMTSDITGTNSGTNTGDNAVNTNYANDYRAANFVAGINYATPTGTETLTNKTMLAATNTVEARSGPNGSAFGFRNKLINGGFDVWQRGTSFTDAVYTADRWASPANGLVTRLPFTIGQTDVPHEPKFFLRSSTTTGANIVMQAIESVRTGAGKVLTLSFYAKASTTRSMTPGYPQLRQQFGTGGSGVVMIPNSSDPVQLTTSWQKITCTFNVPSIAGKTIGTGDYLQVIPTRFDSVVETVDIAQVQLEEGTVATPFEQRPYGLELALCQRYFQPVRVLTVTARSSSTILASGVFPVAMRVAPTMSQNGPLIITTTAADYPQSNTAGSNLLSSSTSWHGTFGNFSGLSIGTPYTGHSISGGSLYLSAEL